MHIANVFLVALCFLSGIHSVQASEAAWFTILKPDGSPFKNTSLYIYDGDIKFKASGKQYPYGDAAKEKHYYLGEAVTDEHGNFGIKVQNYTQRSLLLVMGSVYYAIRIEKSDSLGHTPSQDHIRYVEWEDDSRRVKANHIYSWRKNSIVTIPLSADPLPVKTVERLVLKAYYASKLAPNMPRLEHEKIDALFKPLRTLTYSYALRNDVHRAMTCDHLTLRAYAATYLGRYGVAESVPFLIDALSDESAHVGANYKYAGMATTRHRANLALKDLVGEDFGFQWDAPLDERKTAINQWKNWMAERDVFINMMRRYMADNELNNYNFYRVHMNKEKTEWWASLMMDPPRPGSPALVIDRETHEIRLIKGR